MKSALQKSPIPSSKIFVVKELKEPLFDPKWHFHPEYQIFMVLEGYGTRFIGDNVKPFKKGDISFLGPNVPHLWRSDSDATKMDEKQWPVGIVVYFHENFISENLFHKVELIKISQLLKNSLRGIEVTGKTAKKVAEMLQDLKNLDGFDGVLELLKILNCLSKSKDLKLIASTGYTNSLKEADTERMNKVYTYVMKNFRNKINSAELANLTNMTTTSFSRYFKIHANKTFSDFIIEIRIGNACKLLIEKKMNIAQACYDSGFQSLSNFNKQFKSITKRTPLEYKKAYKMK